jgi:heme/copper-type cytochrome/quinol oxidase subunit 2
MIKILLRITILLVVSVISLWISNEVYFATPIGSASEAVFDVLSVLFTLTTFGLFVTQIVFIILIYTKEKNDVKKT